MPQPEIQHSDHTRDSSQPLLSADQANDMLNRDNLIKEHQSHAALIDKNLIYDDLTKCERPKLNIMGQKGKPVTILRKYMNFEAWGLVFGTFFMVLGQGSSMVIPLMIGWVVDAMTNRDMHQINKLCLIMLGVVIISSIGVFYRAVIFNTMSESIARNLKYDLFRHLVTKDIGFFDKNKTGDILSRMSSDIAIV